MKKQIFLSMLFTAFAFYAHATVRTVSNHPSGGAQYSTLSAAYAASSNGDTLMLEGTDIIYAADFGWTINWTKSLVVIGSGFNPSTPTNKRSKISASTSDSYLNLGAGVNGSKFYGIEFTNAIKVKSSISNVLFEDCNLASSFICTDVSATNITFNNCILDYNTYDAFNINASTTATINLNNCIIDGSIDALGNVSVVYTFDHCIFLKSSGDVFSNVKSPIVMNSIFMNTSSIASAATTGGVFTNNIARLATVCPPAGNTGSGNMVSTDPMFTTYTSGSQYSSTFDFGLQAASPGKNAATDASDIGVHGGSSTFSETGEPLIVPVIRTMTVLNASVESGGTLNVSVTAGKPNED